jgi:hypothetical protein
MSAPIMPQRKPRVLSKIDKLPEDQRQQVWAWMGEGLIYTEIARRCRETLGVSISISSLSTYYSKHSRELLDHPLSHPKPLHSTLVLHVQVRPELLQPSSNSNGK